MSASASQPFLDVKNLDIALNGWQIRGQLQCLTQECLQFQFLVSGLGLGKPSSMMFVEWCS